MKKISLLIPLFASFIFSCDKIENPYPEQIAEPASCDPPVFDSNLNTLRNVLLEDFTGHRCPNCPYAGYTAIELQDALALQGKHLIIVGEHVTELAEPQSNTDGSYATEFRTEEGDNFGNIIGSYSEFFGGASGFSYVPIGLIDRTPYNSNYRVDLGDWSDAIDARFNAPIGANLQMNISYDEVFKQACIHIETEFLTNTSGNFNLVVYVMEDSIVDWQLNGSSPNHDPNYPAASNIENYMHRHVFRCTVNGTWGTEIASGNVGIGETVVKGFNFNFNDPDHPERANWNTNRISFVAYVYDDATKEILQAIEMHMP